MCGFSVLSRIPLALLEAQSGGVRAPTWQTRRPLRARERLAWWVALVGILAVVTSILHVMWTDESLTVEVRLVLFVGVVLVHVGFAATGLVLWRMRPDSPAGALLATAAAVWAVTSLLWNLPGGPLAGVGTVVGYVGVIIIPALLAHTILTFPDGRLHGRRAWWLLLVWYCALPALRLATVALGELRYPGQCGDDCPANPVQLADLPGAWMVVLTLVQVGLMAAALGVTAGFAVARYRAHGSADRRRMLPLMITLAVVAVTHTTTNLWGVLWVAGVTIVQNEVALTIAGLAANWTHLAIPVALVVGLLSTRAARAEVADVVAALRTADPDSTRGVVARVLQDDDALVAVPAPGGAGHVDLGGTALDPALVRADRPGFRRTDLGEGAVLVTRQSTEDGDPVLFAAAVDALRLGLDNARLTAQVRAQLAEVEASRARLAAASDRARHQLERDLHDGAQQQLLGLGMTLVAARRAAPEGSPVAGQLDQATSQLRDSLVELRHLSRGLRPALLAERGLDVAIDDLRHRLPVPLTVRVTLPERPDPVVETTAYYVLAEGLQNVTRHAPEASAHVTVEPADGGIVVLLRDNGPGGADPSRGSGLRGLLDRVRAAGGDLTIASPVGGGTTLRACLPVPVRTPVR